MREHKKQAPRRVTLGIITASTTRTLAEDRSGHWMRKRAEKEGHTVLWHDVVPDRQALITTTVLKVVRDQQPDAILMTGGTGISAADVTIEAVQPLFDKELTAFGALFAQLSFEEIDAAALLSRAAAGVIGKTVVFCMPGSLNACKLACKLLIFPELSHLVKHVCET